MWLDKIEFKSFNYKRKNSKGFYIDYSRMRKVTELICDNCGLSFERPLHELAPSRRNNLYKHFCSDCDAKSLAGKIAGKIRSNKTENLIGKKIKPKSGYLEVYTKKTHKFRPNENWVREHILVMENFLDRRLNKNEVVHHIDGDKTNNHLDNLDLCSINEHNNCHAKSELIIFELYNKGIIGYDRTKKRYYLI